MNWPFRITPPLLDVAEELQHGDKLHGWELAARSGQSAPNVYRTLERLLGAGWVAYEWEQKNPEPGKPRRRFYWLTDEGLTQVPKLLAERRGNPKPNTRKRLGGGSIPGMTMISLIGFLIGGTR